MADYEFEHSVDTTAPAAAVWALWSDVDRWTEWDGELDAVTLEGPFAVGSTGTMAIPGQPPITFALTSVVEGEGFTDETVVPGATLRFVHRVEEVDGRRRITHRLEADGPAAGEIGPFVTEDMPQAVEALARLAEK
ncbi:SRPBCC family protein [Actinosynnema sp. NPDC023658]|uniref:SRPBCC family protein n=1 Tax=Actinosynnema sp. NPDC023658 TaxID=3155465 RepID=UPI0033D1CA0B